VQIALEIHSQALRRQKQQADSVCRKTSRLRLIGRLIALTIVLAAIAIFIWGLIFDKTTYAVAVTNLEMTFVITDADTGQPISNATIDLIAEEHESGVMRQAQVISLVTDQDGKARFVREKNSCEYVIRPFSKTETLIDLTWASVDVAADGYSPAGPIWLHTAKHKDKGRGEGGPKVEFKVPLSKQVQKQ
jgi:hypothetical protein